MDATDIERLADRCREILPTDLSLKTPDEHHSVPLCAIDAIYSIGVRYEGVKNVVSRYEDYWRSKGVDADSSQHTTKDFLDEFGDRRNLGETLFNNCQLTSPRGGIPKADAVVQLLRLLGSSEYNIQTTEELKAHFADQTLDAAIRQVHGQGSGISAKYLFLLAGVDDAVKPDRMIIRFVSKAVGRNVPPVEAQELVGAASRQLQRQDRRLTPRALDHIIWHAQRGD
jgi:hypothetical protein